jgi:hypothetical protein
MRSQGVLGVVLLLVGLVMLYFLRGFILDLILLVLGALAVLIAFVLVFGGLAMIFWRRAW